MMMMMCGLFCTVNTEKKWDKPIFARICFVRWRRREAGLSFSDQEHAKVFVVSDDGLKMLRREADFALYGGEIAGQIDQFVEHV